MAAQTEGKKFDRIEDGIKVSNKKPPVVYVTTAKRLLAEGHQEVELSGIGQAIASVVTAVDILQSQGFVTIKKIQTSNLPRPKIQIWITKSANFDQKYAETTQPPK